MAQSDTLVLVLDLQNGHLASIQTIEPGAIVRNVAALGALAQLHGYEFVLAGVSQPSPGGDWPESLLALPHAQVRRSVVPAWGSESLEPHLEAVNRIVLAGVALDVAIASFAVAAIGAGFQVHIAIDGVGATDPRVEAGTFAWLAARGVGLISVAGFGMGLIRGIDSDEAKRTMAILGALAGPHSPFGEDA